MKLRITFANISRPRDEIKRLECDFRDAMLDYCPSIEKLSKWQETRNWNYSRAYWYGRWAIRPHLTDKEFDRILPRARFE